MSTPEAVFAEEFTGRAPKTVYAVKLRGRSVEGKTKTYVFLYASKGSYDRAVEQLPKGLIDPSDTVTTYVGTVEWTETGQLVPEVKVAPEPKPAKGRKRAA